jgi:hypothetical protein
MTITEPTSVVLSGAGRSGAAGGESGASAGRGKCGRGKPWSNMHDGGISQSKSDAGVSKGDTRVRVTVLLSVAHFRGYLLLQELNGSEAHCVFLWNGYWFRSLKSRV